MTDSSNSERQPERHRRRHIGCLVLVALVAAAIAVFVMMDRRAPEEPDQNGLAPMQGPAEPVPPRPPG